MCGIVGFLDPKRSRGHDDSLQLAETMASVMHARGPDGHGVWADEERGIAFGHRRLAIVDLSEHGVQPMTSADRRYTVTYNGEIYNHQELSDELVASGVRFRGHSDTEVLIEAIARWGLDRTLDRIDGMFAFALWDHDRRELTLARDRLGEKPLYYGRLGNGEIVFGSSLDALAAHPAFDRPIDRDALTLYFRHKYVPSPWTIYSGISKLDPAATITIDAGGAFGAPKPYWSLHAAAAAPTFEGSPEEAVAHLDQLLRRSVRQRMVADVPVGAFLSGGIDSATIVGVAQAVSDRPVRTFTIGSTHDDFDESSDARAIAEHLGTEHTEVIVTDDDALALVGDLASIHDEPFGDSSQIPTRLVSGIARRSVTVALSGDAGDELFGGYNRYLWVPPIWSRLERVPVGLRRTLARTTRAVPPAAWDRAARLLPASRRPQQVGLKVAKVLDVADAASAQEVFHRLTSHWLSPTDLVHGGAEPPTLHTDASRWPVTSSIAEHMMLVDLQTYLPDDILAKVDRTAMSVSLETRVPYLDREIVEFATTLPDDVKIRGGESKWVLRRVLDSYVPPTMMDRPKAGFGLPIATWLRGPLRGWADDLISSDAARGLDRQLLGSTWRDHLSGRRDNAYLLWDVLMFADWCRHRGISEF